MRVFPLIALANFPASCLASGGSVLSVLWLEAALFVAVVGSLFLPALSASSRTIIFVVYLCGVALAASLVWNVPYEANNLVIALAAIGIPSCLWLGALLLALRGKNITSRWRATR
jgi:hypothetical protein